MAKKMIKYFSKSTKVEDEHLYKEYLRKLPHFH